MCAMTARADFVRAVGPRVLHCTARSNLAGLYLNGLMPPYMLAHRAGRDPATLALRRNRVMLNLPDSTTARLNHQLPIVHGLAAANRIIDDHDAASWARKLDERVFFWPEHRGRRFVQSIKRDADTALVWFDSGGLFDVFGPHVWLSPINSGNFRQGGARARRGDWLYCRATDGIAKFRQNRRNRGLIVGTDKVAEVSITKAMSPEILFDLCPVIE